MQEEADEVGMGWDGLPEALFDVEAEAPEREYRLAAGGWGVREVPVGHFDTFQEAQQRHERDVILTNQDAPWPRVRDRYAYELFELTEANGYVHLHDGKVPSYLAPEPEGYVLYRSLRGAALALLQNQQTGLLHLLVYSTEGRRVGDMVFGAQEEAPTAQQEFSPELLLDPLCGLRVLVCRLF